MANGSDPDRLWTVMVYLAGDNNLTDESVFALTEMKKVDTEGRIAVVAQLDPKAPHAATQRYVINLRPSAVGGATPTVGNPGNHTGTLAEDAVPISAPSRPWPADMLPTQVIELAEKGRLQEPPIAIAPPASATGSASAVDGGDAGELDTGDPKNLYDFISWGIEHYPAKHYMVILAGHGAGTEEDFLLRDDHPTDSLSMRELRAAFELVKTRLKKPIDILGMDVCLMSMAEVCYELNDLVDYMVSSESYSPNAGWPYRQILTAWNQALKSDPPPGTEELASHIVDQYVEFYRDYVVGGLSVDQSVLRVSKSADLFERVKALAGELTDALCGRGARDQLLLAHWEAQSYNGELFVDLQDLCDSLMKRFPDHGPVWNACVEVKRVIAGDATSGNGEKLVVKSRFTGAENQFSYGVSIYFPWAEVVSSYADLAFAKKASQDDTVWNDFLQTYVEKTRREPRGFKKGSTVALPALGVSPVVLGAGRFRKIDLRKIDLRGAVNPIHSMRNPPITLVEEGVREYPAATTTGVAGLQQSSGVSTV